ncbi:uncharacterized protein BDZ99DRAFT_92509 [Mytilinidion resinicola]|uniref:Uncharacterized protein n=1 Tax=Mytilinidion resinicola TaxID=574789 RepID=A0A6A6YBN7_9PEZI|nr:uncharacterized protein BDZ99DRAFT_92509 [Mytilinidion resinicola]KAF2806231.1 hypothetical protein BDZ99DRAFT_92509 [Mytilinidion resinicola]
MLRGRAEDRNEDRIPSVCFSSRALMVLRRYAANILNYVKISRFASIQCCPDHGLELSTPAIFGDALTIIPQQRYACTYPVQCRSKPTFALPIRPFEKLTCQKGVKDHSETVPYAPKLPFPFAESRREKRNSNRTCGVLTRFHPFCKEKETKSESEKKRRVGRIFSCFLSGIGVRRCSTNSKSA